MIDTVLLASPKQFHEFCAFPFNAVTRSFLSNDHESPFHLLFSEEWLWKWLSLYFIALQTAYSAYCTGILWALMQILEFCNDNVTLNDVGMYWKLTIWQCSKIVVRIVSSFGTNKYGKVFLIARCTQKMHWAMVKCICFQQRISPFGAWLILVVACVRASVEILIFQILDRRIA